MQAKPIPSALIEVFHPKLGSAKHQLLKSPFQLGRVRGDVVIDDSEVSSSHCQIVWLNDTFHVFDLNSSNGTFLNGHRIAKSRLHDGDTIQIGHIQIRFRLVSENSILDNNAAFSVSKILKNFHPPQLSSPQTQEIFKLLDEEHQKLFENAVLILDVNYANKTSEKLQVFERNCILGRISTIGRFELDEEISRRHTSLTLEKDGSILVSDLGSTNGTFVNDLKIIQPTYVRPTDVVRLGHTSLKATYKLIGRS